MQRSRPGFPKLTVVSCLGSQAEDLSHHLLENFSWTCQGMMGRTPSYIACLLGPCWLYVTWPAGLSPIFDLSKDSCKILFYPLFRNRREQGDDCFYMVFCICSIVVGITLLTPFGCMIRRLHSIISSAPLSVHKTYVDKRTELMMEWSNYYERESDYYLRSLLGMSQSTPRLLPFWNWHTANKCHKMHSRIFLYWLRVKIYLMMSKSLCWIFILKNSDTVGLHVLNLGFLLDVFSFY